MKKAISLVLAVSFLGLGGCASIIHGKYQDINFQTTPPGAKAVIDRKITITTPGSVELRRKYEHEVKICKDNYRPETLRIFRTFSGWYICNLLLAPLIGLIVDGVNGAMWNLAPEKVVVKLQPEGSPGAQAKGSSYQPPSITIPEYWGEKKPVAVLDLEPKMGISRELASLLSEKLRSVVFDLGMFQVIDRKNMDLVLKEQGFHLSDLSECTSSECAIKVGKMLGVTRMLVGSVGKLDQKSMINLQLINVETGEIEAVAEEECFCKKSDLPLAVETAVKRLAIIAIEE